MKKIDQIAISALLHDIGKFMQRAGEKHPFLNNNIEIDRVCPKNNKGIPTHWHSIYTSAFFDMYGRFIPNIFEKFPKPEDNIANLASCHHNPRTEIGWIIAEADRLSSGMDRISYNFLEDGFDEEKDESTHETQKLPDDKNLYKKQKLKSIFTKIILETEKEDSDKSNDRSQFQQFYENANNQKNKNNNINNYFDDLNYYTYKISELNFSEEVFPEPKAEFKDYSNEYNYLWNQFCQKFKNIKTDNIELYLQNLIYILEKFTWCIPSSVIDFPDISLFDHSKTTASLATALYKYHELTDNFSENFIKDRSVPKFLLIDGDFSGIQKYIYNIFGTMTKGSSKILRSRSFYIELLSEITARYLIDQLELNQTNILFSLSGKFLLIAPNHQLIINKLLQLSQEIAAWMKNRFYGELSVNIVYDEFSSNDFLLDNFVNKFRSLSDKVEQKKKEKLGEIILKSSNIDSFIIPVDSSHYINGCCSFCGKEPALATLSPLSVETEEDLEEQRLGQFCKQLKDVGEKLTKSHYLVYARKKINLNEKFIEPLAFFNDNYYVYLFDEKLILNKTLHLDILKSSFNVYSFENDINFPIKPVNNYIPNENGKNLLFEEIADSSCKNTNLSFYDKSFQILDYSFLEDEKIKEQNLMLGRKLLGVLRADVDKMGLIFSYGFDDKDLKKSSLTISRYFTLSRLFNAFFGIYLKNLITSNANFKNIYTVYSGGDDLFLIGPWDVIIDFAITMQEKFKSFTCNNDSVNISAAVCFFKPDFPVKRFAEQTGKVLDEKTKSSQTKIKKSFKQDLNNHNSKNEYGNKINVFNIAVNWNKAKELLNDGLYLELEVKKNLFTGQSKLNKSFLNRFLAYYKMHKDFYDESNVSYKDKSELLKYKALFAYDVGRNIVDFSSNTNKDILDAEGKGDLDVINSNKTEKIRNKELVKKLYELMEKKIDFLVIPITWALYRSRIEVSK